MGQQVVAVYLLLYIPQNSLCDADSTVEEMTERQNFQRILSAGEDTMTTFLMFLQSIENEDCDSTVFLLTIWIPFLQ